MQQKHDSDITNSATVEPSERPGETEAKPDKVKEYGGPKGKEPTRYGDWEKNGRCIDF